MYNETFLRRCSLWLRYGMLLGDTAMMIVNVVGVLLQLFYTGLFYLYASQRVSIGLMIGKLSS